MYVVCVSVSELLYKGMYNKVLPSVVLVQVRLQAGRQAGRQAYGVHIDSMCASKAK